MERLFSTGLHSALVDDYIHFQFAGDASLKVFADTCAGNGSLRLGHNFALLPHKLPMNTPASPTTEDSLIPEVAQLLVTSLNLEMTPEEIAPDTPLYGDGLGLDSIDILEVALAVSKKYGFQLRADDENNEAIYSSLRNLAQHIAKHRTT